MNRSTVKSANSGHLRGNRNSGVIDRWLLLTGSLLNTVIVFSGKFWVAVLTLIRLGGGGHDGPPPRHIARLLGNARSSRAATLYDNFLSSFPHILTPNLWRPGVRFRSYVTLCTCTSDRKWLQNVILCTKSMQIEFSHLVHINMHIFTLNCWN